MKLDEGVGVTGELDIETDTVDGVTVVEWLNGTAGVVVPAVFVTITATTMAVIIIAQPTQTPATIKGTLDLLLILAPSPSSVFSMSNVFNSPFFTSIFFSYSNG